MNGDTDTEGEVVNNRPCRGAATVRRWYIDHVSKEGSNNIDDDTYSDDLDDANHFDMANYSGFVLDDDGSGQDSSGDDYDDLEADSDESSNDGGSNAKYFITVEADPGGGMERVKSRLGFYFVEHWAPVGGCVQNGSKRWVSLNVEEFLNPGIPLQYHFQVEATLNTYWAYGKKELSFETGPLLIQSGSNGSTAVLKKKIIQLPFYKPKPPRVGPLRMTAPLWNDPGAPCRPEGELMLGISVTPVYSVPQESCPLGTEDSVTQGTPKVMSPSKVVITQDGKGTWTTSICMALENVWEAMDNFSDIKLATKDGVSLAAHKFMLAARSPYFRSLIKAESKKRRFDGTLKLPDMNSQPMRVILKWMYTDELQGDLESFVQEVLEGAVQFQLIDMMEALDKKMITFCNPDNMVRLHRIVLPRKNEMPNAFADISRMIKEYLSSLQLE